jgi:transposase InsO family protein
MAFVHRLKGRLAEGCVPNFTTDGLAVYFSAITAHFGRHADQPGKCRLAWQVDPGLLYAQLRKVRQGRRLMHALTEVVCGTRDRFRLAMQALGFTGRVNTAYVERVNLFLRETVAPLSRRTWSLAQTEERLGDQLQWSLARYNFVRPHEALRVPVGDGFRRYRQRTPAMAAGISSRPWGVRELLTYRLI